LTASACSGRSENVSWWLPVNCCPVRSSVIATCTSTSVQRIHSRPTFS
jgi:hypothetical protein